MNVWEWVEVVTLVLVGVDSAFWVYVALRMRKLGALAAPLLARGARFLAAEPRVPPGALGAEGAPGVVGAPSVRVPEVRTTKKGVRYLIDPSTGMARFLRKGQDPLEAVAAAASEPSQVPAVRQDGEPDLNELARKFGFSPSEVADMAAKYGGIPEGSEGGRGNETDRASLAALPALALPPGRGGGSASVTAEDRLIAGGIQAVLSGEASVTEVASTLAPAMVPKLLAELRRSAVGGQGPGGSSNEDGWG